jgi:MFS family permease
VTDRNRWIALYVLCVGMLMIVLDATVVNVALPSIQSDLGFSQSSLAWVVNSYLIAFGGLLLLAGRLGDLVSRRGMFLAGLGVFTAASLLCGVAQSQGLLVAARFVQGAGGAMTSAVILGMIVTMFPEPREQAKAIGVFAFVASAGGAVGLLVGGVLTQAISWHWIFFVNVPIGIATAVLAMRLIDPDVGIGFGDGADVPGAVLITGSLMLGVYTIVEPAAEYGWGAGRTLALGVLSLALLAAFVAREATARSPLVPLRIFRSRNVTGANLIQVLSVAGMFGMFFPRRALLAADPRLRRPRDRSRVPARHDPDGDPLGALHRPPGHALRGEAAGARRARAVHGWARPVHAGAGRWRLRLHVLPVMVLLGTGAGLCFPALMTLAMSGATASDAGLASGLINTTAQVGGALGLAVLATLSASRSNELIGTGESTAAALTSGYHLAFGIGAALVAVAILVAITVLEPERRQRRSLRSIKAPGSC